MAREFIDTECSREKAAVIATAFQFDKPGVSKSCLAKLHRGHGAVVKLLAVRGRGRLFTSITQVPDRDKRRQPEPLSAGGPPVKIESGLPGRPNAQAA